MLNSLAEGVQGIGYDVLVISPVNGDLLENYRVKNIPVTIEPHIQTFSNSAMQILLKYDILFINTIWYWKGVLLGRSLGKKVIWNVHELESVLDRVWSEEGIRESFSRAHLVLLPPRQGKLRYWERTGCGCFKTTYCGIKDRHLKIPRKSKLVVLNSDSIEPRHAQETLIQAYKFLPPEIRNRLTFLFVGKVLNDDYLRYCQSKIGQSKSFYWLDHSPLKKLPNHYDIRINASRVQVALDEVLEAMSIGKTIISTPIGPITDVIRNGVNGLFFDAGDYQQLAVHLKALYRDQLLRERLGREAVETVGRLYGPSKCREAMLDMVSTLASGP